MGRIAGNLLHAEVPVRDGRDLREMGDRENLSPLGQALEGRRDRMRGHAADPGVDLVEHESLATRDRGQRKRDPRELASRGGLRHRTEGQPLIGSDQEDDLVRAARSGLSLAKLAEELTVSQPEPLKLVGHGLGEGAFVGASHCAQLLGERGHVCLCLRDRAGGNRRGILSGGDAVQLDPGSSGAFQQLVEGRCVEATPKIGDPGETPFDLLQRPRIRLQRREERVEVAPGLAEAERDIAQLGRDHSELGRNPLERRQRAFGLRGQRRRTLPFLRSDRLDRSRGRLLQLGDVTQPLTLCCEARPRPPESRPSVSSTSASSSARRVAAASASRVSSS